MIALTSPNGRGGVALIASDVGGLITSFDGEGTRLVTLSVTEGGQGMVTTFDRKGTRLVTIGAAESGNGAVVTFDRRGTQRIALA